MTTDITQDHRRAFEALTSGEAGNFCLFSCFVSSRPAAVIAAVAVVDTSVNLPAGGPSRSTCGKPLQPPTLAKRREIDAGRRIPAVRAILGAQAERQFLVSVGNTKRRW